MLTAHEVLHGYSLGIFPMAEPDEDHTIYWYEPEFRGIILPEEFRCPKNLRRTYNKGDFDLYINRDFVGVMRACAQRDETWISEEIIEVYHELMRMGYGFSFEVWKDNEMAGGLYGVAIGRVFFGESMFHKVTDASKIALVFLMDWMNKNEFRLLDCQFITDHLKQFGAREIPQKAYLQLLQKFILR